MNKRIISREELPPYSPSQWATLTRGKDVILCEILDDIPFGILHKKIQKAVLVIDKATGKHKSTLLLEVIKQKVSSEEGFVLHTNIGVQKVILLYTPVKVNRAKGGVFTYVVSNGMISMYQQVDTEDIVPHLSFSYLNPKFFKLKRFTRTISLIDRTREFDNNPIIFPKDTLAKLAAITLSGLVTDTNQLRGNYPVATIPTIMADSEEKVDICGKWKMAATEISSSGILPKSGVTCFYDEDEMAYCAIQYAAINTKLYKFESIENLRLDYVDSSYSKEDIEYAKELYYSILTDSCSAELLSWAYSIDWEVIISWCFGLGE